MRPIKFSVSLMCLLAAVPMVRGQSLWDRRDPQTAYLFTDTRARHYGDLLTIVVNESTEFEGMDKKEMNKDTSAAAALNLQGKYSAGDLTTRKFTGDASGQSTSSRTFNGKANNTIDRKLVDRMTVTVVGVLPNGNLVLEGRRARVITNETRTLVVTGICRPIDIGPYNTIQSSFIADFIVTYEGKGPESSYTNNGWLGKIVNKIWPF